MEGAKNSHHKKNVSLTSLSNPDFHPLHKRWYNLGLLPPVEFGNSLDGPEGAVCQVFLRRRVGCRNASGPPETDRPVSLFKQLRQNKTIGIGVVPA